jgi:5'-deoxynucleotidase YfbR-like HD superfamily hydrolase
VARWNGQTSGDHAFSVAQHCLLVETLLSQRWPKLDRRWRLAGLLHDAPEYVIGDMISPFKAAMGIDYRAFEKRLLAAIHVRFGLPATIPVRVTSLIKHADRAAAFLEATQLAGFDLGEARKYFGMPRGYSERGGAALPFLKPLAPGEASAQYLRKFQQLS